MPARPAWRAAKGDYFLWLDSQTWLTPRYVELGARFLDSNASHVLVCGGVTWRSEKGEPVRSAPASVAYEDPVRRLELFLTNLSGGEAWYGLHRRSALGTIALHERAGLLLCLARVGRLARQDRGAAAR